MKKTGFAVFVFFIACSVSAQTDMGRYREVQLNDTGRCYILKSQRCADIDAADKFWGNTVFAWNQKGIINNQQDAKDYPDAFWKQASPEMFEWVWSYKQHFENGTAYVIRFVNNIDNRFRLIDLRLIYFSPDGKTVWYYSSLESLWEPY